MNDQLAPETAVPFRDLVDAYKRSLIRSAMKECGGIQARAARHLGLKPQTLHAMMKRLGVLEDPK